MYSRLNARLRSIRYSLVFIFNNSFDQKNNSDETFYSLDREERYDGLYLQFEHSEAIKNFKKKLNQFARCHSILHELEEAITALHYSSLKKLNHLFKQYPIVCRFFIDTFLKSPELIKALVTFQEHNQHRLPIVPSQLYDDEDDEEQTEQSEEEKGQLDWQSLYNQILSGLFSDEELKAAIKLEKELREKLISDAEKGDSHAAFKLSSVFANDLASVYYPFNDRIGQCIKFTKLACFNENPHPRAIYNLACYYTTGANGIKQNLNKAYFLSEISNQLDSNNDLLPKPPRYSEPLEKDFQSLKKLLLRNNQLHEDTLLSCLDSKMQDFNSKSIFEKQSSNLDALQKILNLNRLTNNSKNMQNFVEIFCRELEEKAPKRMRFFSLFKAFHIIEIRNRIINLKNVIRVFRSHDNSINSLANVINSEINFLYQYLREKRSIRTMNILNLVLFQTLPILSGEELSMQVNHKRKNRTILD